MRTRHTVRDGRKHFPIFVAGFFLRMIGFLVMLVLSILLFIVGSWFASGQIAAEFLQMKDEKIIGLNITLSYATGTLCLLVSLYLLVTAILMGNFMFKERNLSHLVKKKQMGTKVDKFTNQ